MLKVKNILNKEFVVKGIKGNLKITDREFSEILNEIDRTNKNNEIKVELEKSKNTVEILLYVDKSENIYLIDVRAFNKEDKMINAYLEVLDKDMRVKESNIDDVWEYANWEIVG